MKYSLYVDQLVLENWKGKINASDCLILAFIQDLNPNDPTIKSRMRNGYFLVSVKWLSEELPLLQVSEKTFSRHLSNLVDIGILERIKRRTHSGMYVSYYKISKTYYQVSKKRHAEVDVLTRDKNVPGPRTKMSPTRDKNVHNESIIDSAKDFSPRDNKKEDCMSEEDRLKNMEVVGEMLTNLRINLENKNRPQRAATLNQPAGSPQQ